MRVADYIAEALAGLGLRHVFLVTGGGAMHLNDAFGRAEGLSCVCFHNEQGAAMAADGYARVGGKPAVLNVTTGPGGYQRPERRVRRLYRQPADGGDLRPGAA